MTAPRSASAPAGRGPAPRPGLLDLTPYQGGDSKVPGVDRVHKMSSNEGPLGASPRAREAYAAAAASLHRYPDGGCTALRRAIGARHGLDPDRLVCGAGSDELICLLARAWCGEGDEVVHSAHGFLMYAIYARQVGAMPVAAPERDLTTDVDAILAAVTPRTRMVFVANPNNPTGTYLPEAEIARLRAGLPDDVMLVLDAAYAECVSRNDYADGRALVDAAVADGTENTVVLRTFSKLFGLGGARVGWGYFPPAVADVMNRIRSPFNVPGPSQAAATAAMEDLEFQALAEAHNRHWLGWLDAKVRALGYGGPDSVANFLLVRFPGGPAEAAAADAHLRSHGVLVRRMGSYGLPDCLRVSVGLEDDNEAFVAALTGFAEGRER